MARQLRRFSQNSSPLGWTQADVDAFLALAAKANNEKASEEELATQMFQPALQSGDAKQDAKGQQGIQHRPPAHTSTPVDWQRRLVGEVQSLHATVSKMNCMGEASSAGNASLMDWQQRLMDKVASLDNRIKRLEGQFGAELPSTSPASSPKLTFHQSVGQQGTKSSKQPSMRSIPSDVPKSYDDALESLGGKNELERFRFLSESLSAKYSVDEDIAKLLPDCWSKRLANSVRINFQTYADTLDELMDAHKRHLEPFRAKISEISSRTGARATYPPLKSRDRAEAKANFKYMDSNGGVAWYRLTDILRDTLVFDTLEAMYQGLLVIDSDEDIDIIEFNDRYMRPLKEGYRDLQLTIRFQGLVCELQLSTSLMTNVKEYSGHRTFEVQRELVAAVADGSVKRCRKILQWGLDRLGSEASADLQKVLDDPNSCLLHKAAGRGHADIVNCFLQYTANVNLRDESGRTPLHSAMAGGHERAAWALLNQGQADFSLTDTDGVAPLLEGLIMLRTRPEDEKAARTVSLVAQTAGKSHRHTIQQQLPGALKSRYQLSSDLAIAAFDGHFAKVKALLCEFADPDSRHLDGRPALHVAYENGYKKVVSLLLHASANPNATSKNGKDLLQITFERGDIEVYSMALGVTSLKKLNLANENITDACDIAKGLARNASLLTVNLENNQIVDVSCFVLVLQHNTSIETLSLNNNQIVDISDFAKALALNSSLKELRLYSNKIRDVSDIATALERNTSLEKLSLHYNQITDILGIAKALYKNTTLKELWLGNNQLDEESQTILTHAWHRSGRGAGLFLN